MLLFFLDPTLQAVLNIDLSTYYRRWRFNFDRSLAEALDQDDRAMNYARLNALSVERLQSIFWFHFVALQTEGKWEALNFDDAAAIGETNDTYRSIVDDYRVRWNRIRKMFEPQLEGFDIRIKEPDQARAVLDACSRSETAMRDAWIELATEERCHCFGIFGDVELRYIAKTFPRVADVGCGYGLSVACLRRLGCEAFGIDSDARGFLSCPLAETTALIEQGQILRGGVELLGTLSKPDAVMLSWPEPGSSMAADTLKTCRELEIRTLLLKVGALFNTINQRSRTLDEVLNCERFLDELGEHWQHVLPNELPPFSPIEFRNYMWQFQLR